MGLEFNDPLEQEVWQTVRDLNDAWTKGRPQDLTSFFHRDMVAITPTDRERLEGREACYNGWNDFVQSTTIHYWKETEPRIQIYGPAAVVTYYFEMSFDQGGQTINLGGRDMFFLVKEGGKWLAVADQFSPYPTA